MRWIDFDSEACSVHRTLEVVGEKWTMLLIRDAANGVHRFDDFRRHVGLSEAVLADRLRTLVGHGILETREYQEPGQRKRREYRLTEKGWDLFPVLVALMQFGDKHLRLHDGELRALPTVTWTELFLAVGAEPEWQRGTYDCTARAFAASPSWEELMQFCDLFLGDTLFGFERLEEEPEARVAAAGANR